MGIFHCIDSGCAVVRYQPYKNANGIRYRFPDGDWITVNGDDYTIDKQNDFGDNPHRVSLQATFNVRRPELSRYPLEYQCGDRITGVATPDRLVVGKIVESTLSEAVEGSSVTLNLTFLADGREIHQEYYFTFRPYTGFAIDQGIAYVSDCGDASSSFALGVSFDDLQVVYKSIYGTPTNNPCVLTIYKNEEIIETIESEECPEVEILDGECELSDRTEVIKIEKFPFLERVEVTDYDYQNDRNGVRRQEIPDNCLVVRNNQSTAIPPLSENFPSYSNSALGADFTYGFIQQICSDEGCPPPEYEVLCNCEGEECPTGTCPQQCGSVVCCYNPNTGQAEAEIPIEDYSGGGL